MSVILWMMLATGVLKLETVWWTRYPDTRVRNRKGTRFQRYPKVRALATRIICDGCGLCVVDILTEDSPIYYNSSDIPFSRVKFTVQLKRKSLYYVINLVLPCCVYPVLSIITFILPPACGERVGVGQCLINLPFNIGPTDNTLS